MKVIIAGGRDFADYNLLATKCTHLFQRHTDIEVVSGAASGADMLGERYADAMGLPVSRFPADWAAHGKAAGHVRNSQMAAYADALVLFWDGRSRGSASMLGMARKHNLLVRIVYY
jgi:hypothetical protein